MAASLSPLPFGFFPPYAPTPAPPECFHAPPCAPSLPSTATYHYPYTFTFQYSQVQALPPPDSPHHTQIHGCCCPPPFPNSYPYPPPASSHMAATGLSPVQTYDPATPATPALGSFPFGFPPDSAYAPAPTFHAPITTKIDRNQPAPAATQIHVDLHHHFPPTGDHLLVQPAPQPTSPILPTLPASRLTSGSALAGRTALELHTQEVPCTPENSGGATFPLKKSGGVCRPAMPDLSCQGRDLTKGNNTSNSETLSMVNASTNHRFVMEDDAAVQAVAEERVPAKDATLHRLQQQERDQIFDTIQGQLAKLTSMAAQLAVSIGKQSSAAASSSVSPLSSPVGASSVVTTPTIASVFATSASTLPSATAYTALPVFGEMPQQYDFHNLSRKTVFLADGSEHSYYVLPEDYPLEQATSPMSPSAVGNVGVTAPPSVAAHEACLAPVFCSKTNNTADSALMLVPNLHPPMTVQDVSSVFKEMSVYDQFDEGNRNWPNEFISLPENTIEKQKNEDEQTIYGLEKLIGGENLSFAKQDGQQLLKCSSKVSAFQNVPDVYVRRTGQEEPQIDRKLFWKKSVCQSATGHSISFFPWDPGDTKFHDLSMTATGATKFQCTYVYKSAMVQILAVQFGARRAPIFESAIMRSYALRWTEVNAATVVVLAVPCSKGKYRLFLSNGGNSRTNHSVPKLFMQSLWASTAVQVSKKKHPLDFLSMAKMWLNGSEFRDGQLAYMPQDTSVGSEWCLSGYNASDKAVSEEATDFTFQHGPLIHDDRSIKLTNEKSTQTASIVCVHEAIVHCHDESSEINIKKQNMIISKHDITSPCDQNNDKLVSFVLHYQFPRSSTPCTWDPGIVSLLFSCKRMNITELIQIKGWTSMTYSGISSSEYPYTIIFLHDQWEFTHQQGVHENYNAKHLLLSSQTYVQIWELGIIFITFRPP